MADQALRDDPQFLASQNVQQVKRNILAGFTKALLLPVTIVPKTVAFGVNALTYGGSMALSAVSGGLVGGNSTPKPITTASAVAAAEDSVVANGSIKSPPSTASSSFVASASRGFGMLLSLDTAMQLIQADRDCLKRIQTFASYSAYVGFEVDVRAESKYRRSVRHACQVDYRRGLHRLVSNARRTTSEACLYKVGFSPSANVFADVSSAGLSRRWTHTGPRNMQSTKALRRSYNSSSSCILATR